MSINKSLANQLLTEVKNLENEIKYTENVALTTNFREYANEFYQQYLEILSDKAKERLDGLLNKDDRLNDRFFPRLLVSSPSQAQRSLFTDLVHNSRISFEKEKLNKEFSSVLTEMKSQLNYIRENDKHPFFQLFYSKSKKEILSQAKKWVEDHKTELDSLTIQLESLNQKYHTATDDLDFLKNNRSEIYNQALQILDYKPNFKDSLFSALGVYSKNWHEKIEPIDEETLAIKIKEYIHQIQIEKSKDQVLNQPIELMQLASDSNIPVKQLKTRGIHDIGDLQKAIISQRLIYYFSQESVSDLKDEMDSFINEFQSNYYPRFDLKTYHYLKWNY
ncbi:hypothetical protein ACWOBE_06845 [Hutsoniella sourekii]